jgi:alpha-tubulin suppressor-like RCC1 family protein
MRLAWLLLVLAACRLDVDYKGTNYQCNPDGTCPPNYACVDMVCVPSDPVPPACSDDVSAGGLHSCAVRKDGSVWCWGRNDFGQLGDSTTVDSAIPVQVMGMKNAVAVGAGSASSCALDNAGTVFCWGRNDAGQLGDGTMSDSRAPVAVSNLTGVSQISIGANHACVLKTDGSVACWGANMDGQLGDGTTTARNTAGAVDVGGQVTSISAGSDISCAVLGDGRVKCWGENNEGELGVGDMMNHPRPTAVVGVTNAMQVSAGDDHTCVLDKNGFVYCAGLNDEGQLGNGTQMSSPTFVRVDASIGAIQIEAGDRHTCMIDGTQFHDVWCWGSDDNGRGTDGLGGFHTRPERGLLTDVSKVSAGGEHTCAVDLEGAIRCAGFNRRGQLGDGRAITTGAPTPVPGITNATLVATGARHSCAALADGRIMCWGENDEGECGNGGLVSPALAPTPVYGVANAKELVAGDEHTCAILDDNGVYCWGFNNAGQLGDGTMMLASQPRGVTALTNTATHVIAANDTTCALVNGGARCWGDMFGLAPQMLNGVKSVAPGEDHVCSVQSDNSVLCYGDGFQYQLGNNSQGFQGAPGVTPTGLATAAEVFARGNQSCAKLADGTAKCWGLNEGGRLGTGMTMYYVQTPQTVMGVSAVQKFTIGQDGSCALKTDGTVWCWGTNYNGGVGDGSYTLRNSAVQLPGLTGVKDVATGGGHGCAVNADGTVVCWGLGGSGQLGNGVREIRVPVGVRMTCP